MKSKHDTAASSLFRISRTGSIAFLAAAAIAIGAAGCASGGSGQSGLGEPADGQQFMLTAYQDEPAQGPATSPAHTEPLDPPEWFDSPPPNSADAWFVTGTATSTESAMAAMQAAEDNAVAAASRAAGEMAQAVWSRILLARSVGGDAPDEGTINSLSPDFEAEPVIGAVPDKSVVRKGKRRDRDGLLGDYYQGYVLLRVPADNFVFDPARCLKKMRLHLLQRDQAGAIHVLRGAALCWPDDTEILQNLANLQESTGRLDDAIETAQQLRTVSPDDSLKAVNTWISTLKKEHSGSEFAFMMQRMLAVQKDAEQKSRLEIEPRQNRIQAGRTASIKVRSDRPWEFCGVWLDSEGIQLVPVGGAAGGTVAFARPQSRFMTVDSAMRPGPHLFMLLASSERPDWFENRRFEKDEEGYLALDAAAKESGWSLERILDDLEKRASTGDLLTAAMAVEIVP
jgi:hypothetical protein